MDKSYEIISQNYSYLIDRITQTQNFLLKAIYSEILYYSNEPEYKSYIRNAVENYYEVLNKAFEGFGAGSELTSSEQATNAKMARR